MSNQDPKAPNPVGDEPPQGDQPGRRAPGSEQEYQGGQPEQKRAPGVEQDDKVDDGGEEKRRSA